VRRPGRQDGFTLVEMLVTILIFGIVAISITGATMVGFRSDRETNYRAQAIAAGRTALERIDRDIRAADPLVSVSATTLVLDEDTSTAQNITRTVTYQLVNGKITVNEVDTSPAGCLDNLPTNCTTTTTLPQTVLLTSVVNTTATQPVFVLDTTATTVMQGGQPLVLNGSNVTLKGETVTVKLMIQPSTINAPVTVTDNGTNLRNAG
jgi:prepilin-type N-terminal cleavage/methylation domain-containing protein